ncbi:MAG TPA: hypothetical protein VM144_00085 [Aestuariivirga sp.]|nr:hypothetical protein [Aestuariivirga sp.]
MKHPPNHKNIRERSNPAAELPRPYLSQNPWAGFTKHDRPRDQPLPACPSKHCRRAKACLAAHDNLYCQRTHFSPAKIRKLWTESPLGRALAALPVADRDDLEGRTDRIIRGREIRHAHFEKMVARWKAGEFDQLYGAYTPKGVLLKPPPKVYVERPAISGAKGAGQGRAGDV